jgi:hypothetical protein
MSTTNRFYPSWQPWNAQTTPPNARSILGTPEKYEHDPPQPQWIDHHSTTRFNLWLRFLNASLDKWWLCVGGLEIAGGMPSIPRFPNDSLTCLRLMGCISKTGRGLCIGSGEVKLRQQRIEGNLVLYSIIFLRRVGGSLVCTTQSASSLVTPLSNLYA